MADDIKVAGKLHGSLAVVGMLVFSNAEIRFESGAVPFLRKI